MVRIITVPRALVEPDYYGGGLQRGAGSDSGFAVA